MSRRQIAARLQQVVYELCTVRPHVPEGLKLPYAELVAYWRGYTWAVQMALRVMEASERVEDGKARARRDDRRAARAAQRPCAGRATNGRAGDVGVTAGHDCGLEPTPQEPRAPFGPVTTTWPRVGAVAAPRGRVQPRVTPSGVTAPAIPSPADRPRASS